MIDLIYVKGWKPRKEANVIRLDGHTLFDSERIDFEAVLYSFDPQLDKNVRVTLTEEALDKLDLLGLDKSAIETLVQAIQLRLLKDTGIVYELE